MNNPKHTPGPWRWQSIPGQVAVDTGDSVFWSKVDGDVAKANARLIAAAPDALSFARSIEDRVTLIRRAFKERDQDKLEQLITDLDADAFDLIAKATGGSDE